MIGSYLSGFYDKELFRIGFFTAFPVGITVADRKKKKAGFKVIAAPKIGKDTRRNNMTPWSCYFLIA
jgi:hypothetical protein